MLIERIFKNPKTTILGLLIIALCFTLVWGGRATLTEVSTFMVGAFALMFFKDPQDGKAAGGKPTNK
jgi:Na+/alanine symporter